MNIKSIKKITEHLVNACKEYVVPILASDGSNAGDFYCADVVGNRRFAQNYGGYPRSDIAEINSQVTIEAKANLLNDLVDYSPSDNPNAGKTDAEIMLGHKSKYIQTPSEMVRWLDGQLEIRDARRVSQSAPSSPKEGAIDFNNGDDNNGAE